MQKVEGTHQFTCQSDTLLKKNKKKYCYMAEE